MTIETKKANSDICRICKYRGTLTSYIVKEMHLGIGDNFEYLECPGCGCLQIKDIPDDLSNYYPDDYYSFLNASTTLDYSGQTLHGLRRRLISKQLTRHFFGRKTSFGRWLANRSSLVNDYPLWVRRQKLDLQLKFGSKILDVGCGTGKLLLDLRELGFTNLFGVDPFLDQELNYDGVTILNCELSQLDDQFDFIMFHHSFEHMANPVEVLKTANRLLKPSGYLLIRIPVAGSHPWRKYGVKWVSLDAPRHLHLHTPKSIQLLAQETEFEVKEVFFDGEGFAHWGSEQYLAGLPLRIPGDLAPPVSRIPKETLAAYEALDHELNDAGDSDHAGFYLQRDHAAGK